MRESTGVQVPDWVKTDNIMTKLENGHWWPLCVRANMMRVFFVFVFFVCFSFSLFINHTAVCLTQEIVSICHSCEVTASAHHNKTNRKSYGKHGLDWMNRGQQIPYSYMLLSICWDVGLIQTQQQRQCFVRRGILKIAGAAGSAPTGSRQVEKHVGRQGEVGREAATPASVEC